MACKHTKEGSIMSYEEINELLASTTEKILNQNEAILETVQRVSSGEKIRDLEEVIHLEGLTC